MDSATTVVGAMAASILSSGVVAAIVTAILGGRNEREKQIRETQIKLAGDYAGNAMAALGSLRHYKPTTGTGHRNELLHSDEALRAARSAEVENAIDALRPLRGQVWVRFPGRSGLPELQRRGPQTTSDWAERVIGDLRETKRVCDAFWDSCARDPASRPSHEDNFDREYDVYKGHAWQAIDQFANSASIRISGKQ